MLIPTIVSYRNFKDCDRRQNIAMSFDTEKLQYGVATQRWKSLRICVTVNRCVTDGQTDRQTDGRTSCDDIVRAMHSIAR